MEDESQHSHDTDDPDDSCSSSSSSSGRSHSSADPTGGIIRDVGTIPVIDSVASCLDDDDDDDNYHDNDDNDNSCWTLQIKRVGETAPDFCVTVHPEDPLQRLLEAIGSHTGWSCTEQRLIYRGRLLTPEKGGGNDNNNNSNNNKNSSKVRDIAGLTDGHTIHLMRKPSSTENTSTDESHPIDPHEPSNVESTSSGTNTSISAFSSGSSSLLAALLGVGANSNNNSPRRVPYRLQESDLIRPDPGSLEAVRQGLLTLHTMQAEPSRRPFYLGQWIDCRDTVNQWLEATVVNIVDPRDVLPDLKTDQEDEPEDGKFYSCRSNATLSSCSAAAVTPTSDPAIAVTDLDGRRRLLLEPCEEHEAEGRIEGVYYRRRSTNSSVQLLHIHYNGWPVRWDEWIRSDSERIRPFRVRTRHPSSQSHASPTVVTPLTDPPRTHFTHSGSTETHDRQALLPELHRAVDRVQELLQRAAAAAGPCEDGVVVVESSPHLPWNAASCSTTTTTSAAPPLQERQRELQTLAPLLDRLGRVLTDAAPHVAALATSLQQQQDTTSSSSEEEEEEDDTKRNHNPHTLGGLLSLLSRDRRGHEQSVASSNAAVPSAASWESGNEHGTIVEDDDEDDDDDDEIPVDPDLSDFRTGFVNTTRGELRRRGGGNSTTSSSDELANLLGAYLAAASLGGAAGTGSITSIGGGGDGGDGSDAAAAEGLGRLLRGGNGGGIDIHIHAVVTTPTGAAAGLFARDAPPTRTRLLTSPTAATASFLPSLPLSSPNNTAVDDDGIFAELYSANPDPVNMNGSNTNNANEANRSNNNNNSSHASSTGRSVSDNNNNENMIDHPQRRRHRSSSRRRPNNNNHNSQTSSGNGGVLGRFFRRDRSNH